METKPTSTLQFLHEQYEDDDTITHERVMLIISDDFYKTNDDKVIDVKSNAQGF